MKKAKGRGGAADGKILRRFSKKDLITKLTESEKAQFERARYAEEHAKKRSFVLGGSGDLPWRNNQP